MPVPALRSTGCFRIRRRKSGQLFHGQNAQFHCLRNLGRLKNGIMRVLITGGAGFIGSHLVQYFQGKAEVRVLDNLRTGHRRNLNGFDFEWMEGSILDRNLVKRAVDGVDYVFHLAALVSVPESMAKPQECVELNVTGLLTLMSSIWNLSAFWVIIW